MGMKFRVTGTKTLRIGGKEYRPGKTFTAATADKHGIVTELLVRAGQAVPVASDPDPTPPVTDTEET